MLQYSDEYKNLVHIFKVAQYSKDYTVKRMQGLFHWHMNGSQMKEAFYKFLSPPRDRG